MKKLDKWLRAGYTEAECARLWNGGSTQIKQGVNKYGQPYDTLAYSQTVVAYLERNYGN